MPNCVFYFTEAPGGLCIFNGEEEACLYFGLGPAFHIFTKLMKTPIAVLHKLKSCVIVYLDNMLLMSQMVEEINKIQHATSRVCNKHK